GPGCGGVGRGAMVMESIYGEPGVGPVLGDGALNRDYSMVLRLNILVGALSILFNAFFEVLYAFIDPNIL
ncbi:oligopeptide transporter permease, partial [Erwinia amylovora]|nr:oligopeptide transporter permease [Erwinia amylovora]